MEIQIGKARLALIKGDITTQEVDALVNIANDRLWMGGGIAGIIKKQGGEIIEEQAMEQGPANVGDIVVTDPGALKVKKILHAVIMGQDLKTNEQAVRETTKNLLQFVDDNNINSIAIPPFGTEVGHLPARTSAQIMIDEIIDFLIESETINEVKLVLAEDGVYSIFQQELEHKFSRPSAKKKP